MNNGLRSNASRVKGKVRCAIYTRGSSTRKETANRTREVHRCRLLLL